jgi:hypothetical protein
MGPPKERGPRDPPGTPRRTASYTPRDRRARARLHAQPNLQPNAGRVWPGGPPASLTLRVASLQGSPRKPSGRHAPVGRPAPGRPDGEEGRRPPTTSQEPAPMRDRTSHPSNSEHRASHAVALAFAQVIAERYPGTSWLPVERNGSNDLRGMPAGKVIRLAVSPQDQHARPGVGRPTTPAAPRRASHKHRTNASP